jgi:2,4-dienoyl-CoA reductase-like NADH-dependent reductase (Old Yellow Enzyme family)/thioredoxin reductase
MTDSATLWEAVPVGTATARNRVVVAAHQTHYPAEGDGGIGDRYVEYMAERARGGAGLLIVEAAAVHPSTEKVGLLNLFREEIVPGMKRLTQAVHAHGAPLFAQLSHLGNQDAGTSRLDRWHPVLAPTALPSVATGRSAKEMDAEEIADVIHGYGQAAANAQAAGCDGVEISAGHGYLVCQFLSPLTNRRSDSYGGTPENRCRFAIEAAAEVRRRCGSDYPLGIRLSFDEFVGEAGLTPRRSEELIRILHASSLFDYFSITAGNYHSINRWVPTASAPGEGALAAHARAARGAVDASVPIVVAAGIRSIERAAEIAARRDADLVAMTRGHIADPALVSKARSGRSDEIVKCVGANQGCLRRAFANQGITCTVNPIAGREGSLGRAVKTRSPQPGHLLVIGGGPAGLKLAETAAGRGHRVTLLERERELGGQLNLSGRLPGRETWLELRDGLASSVRRLGVEVQLGTEADIETVRRSDADLVFIATGAHFERRGFSVAVPGREAIPGAHRGHVIDTATAIREPQRCRETVVVIDDNGDHASLALCLLLAAAGRSVGLVTRHPRPGNSLVQTAANVRCTTEAHVVRIESEAVIVRSGWRAEERSLPALTVVLNMMRHSDSLPRQLADAGLRATAIGDCLAPREVDDAIYEGARFGASA